MELQQLTADNFATLKKHNVFIVSYSDYYLEELCTDYDILPYLCGGFDERPHRQGKHFFRDKVIEVANLHAIVSLPTDAVLLILDGYPQECFRKLTLIPKIADKFSVIYFFADKEMAYDLAYRDKYRNIPLKNIILFRTGAGASQYIEGDDFSDNGRALFEYMMDIELDKEYELVWLVRNPACFDNRYKGRNVKFISYNAATADDDSERDEYYRYLCLAKYIFATHLMIFARNARKDQIRVQLWHGCAFKRSMRMPEEYQYEYMVVSSMMFAVFHADIFGLRPDQMLISGLPKQDYLFKPLPDWKKLLDIPIAKKYIFWLPTWRTTKFPGQENDPVINPETGLPIFATFDDFCQLDKFLHERDIVLIIKTHPWQNEIRLDATALSNIVLLRHETIAKIGIFINELLGHADALVSDYSSAAVDYMLLNRPLAFTLDDYEEIKSHRGFHWRNLQDWLPGKEIYNCEDFMSFISDVHHGKDAFKEKRNKLMTYFHSYTDGKNSAHVLSLLGIHDES